MGRSSTAHLHRGSDRARETRGELRRYGRIDALDFTILEDDLNFFPAYTAASVFYADTFTKGWLVKK